jgi:hypothetical protein
MVQKHGEKRNKMKNILTAMISAFIIGCASCSGVNDDPKPYIDIVDDLEDCGPACATAEDLDCPEAENLVFPGTTCIGDGDCVEGMCIDGQCAETCEMTCEAFVRQGVKQGLECWITMTACEEIETVCKG